ncbi:MAG TPA: MarR family transcriptional regulator [Candidatus Dormibacteraeota bacterium]|jgi:DNA-binding MarR family transcriptional regulator|nr:MarR family transcriptional regulator [Candidatus Dormibacteraeota bacterium]
MAEKITSAEYRALAELRYRIRLFLREGDTTALAEGLEPQQYQMLLAIRGLEDGEIATIGTLAERLAIKHHSAVELIDRLEKRGFVKRLREKEDRRQVRVVLLPRGEKALATVVRERIGELRASGAALVRTIETLLQPRNGKPNPKQARKGT